MLRFCPFRRADQAGSRIHGHPKGLADDFRATLKAALGEHNHEGPGIRQVTSGYMTYVLPDKTVVYAPGDFFFESGDINHTVFNKTDTPMVHVLFEILPVNLNGPSLIPVRHH
ncbi:cupin domain-containing protein [Bradyrhizobium sp. 155]|uniref:cupin domain-containing protein n=1 Tax=Bradyrhizobium sp. 155 TaxID=2782629 RepID=UPI003211DC95